MGTENSCILSGRISISISSALEHQFAIADLEPQAWLGAQVAAGVLLDVKLSQNDYAQLSLGSRQRINKIFGEWRERGIVTLAGSQLLIRDLPALQAEKELEQDAD